MVVIKDISGIGVVSISESNLIILVCSDFLDVIHIVTVNVIISMDWFVNIMAVNGVVSLITVFILILIAFVIVELFRQAKADFTN